MSSDDTRSDNYQFCPQCGAAGVPGAGFCVECGTSLIRPGNSESDTSSPQPKASRPVSAGTADASLLQSSLGHPVSGDLSVGEDSYSVGSGPSSGPFPTIELAVETQEAKTLVQGFLTATGRRERWWYKQTEEWWWNDQIEAKYDGFAVRLVLAEQVPGRTTVTFEPSGAKARKWPTDLDLQRLDRIRDQFVAAHETKLVEASSLSRQPAATSAREWANPQPVQGLAPASGTASQHGWSGRIRFAWTILGGLVLAVLIIGGVVLAVSKSSKESIRINVYYGFEGFTFQGVGSSCQQPDVDVTIFDTTGRQLTQLAVDNLTVTSSHQCEGYLNVTVPKENSYGFACGGYAPIVINRNQIESNDGKISLYSC